MSPCPGLRICVPGETLSRVRLGNSRLRPNTSSHSIRCLRRDGTAMFRTINSSTSACDSCACLYTGALLQLRNADGWSRWGQTRFPCVTQAIAMLSMRGAPASSRGKVARACTVALPCSPSPRPSTVPSVIHATQEQRSTVLSKVRQCR